MPRAHRIHLPGQVWHLTHRCHHRQFLLKFARDRRAWVRWLFEARKRFGLCVLNYQVTCNHIHLLVQGRDRTEVWRSMQLIAGCVARAYNRRKRRRGAFWEDCYHATAVDTEEYLVRCLVYIDLNMVRAGVVAHPREWSEAGYHEIQHGAARYRIIDRVALCELLGVTEQGLAKLHNEWVESRLVRGKLEREPEWSEAVAVGRRRFVEQVQEALGAQDRYRRVEEVGDRIGHTRALLSAALKGQLEGEPSRRDPVFGFEVPTNCPIVPDDVLDPSTSWSSKEDYDKKYSQLAARLVANFRKFGEGIPATVLEAGPRALR